MRNLRKNAPSVNAGSMADIAFLLLIFFLVTTTISADKGILRKLPDDCSAPPCTIDVNERNILEVFINKNNKLMVEDSVIEISELKNSLIEFVDNNGSGDCNYCSGKQSPNMSDNPQKAIISLKHDPLTNYGTFIDVQDEISKAYLQLRAAYAQNYFNKIPDELTIEEIKLVKKAYPFLLSEVLLNRK